MLNFDFFLKKISFSATFCVWFKKMLLILYSNNWPNFIIWLSLLLAILGNMCIANACFPGRDVIIFEINLILLIKLFYYMTEKSRQKFKYLQKERWKKTFFTFLKGFHLPKIVPDLRVHLSGFHLRSPVVTKPIFFFFLSCLSPIYICSFF